jgi:polyisoprenoid-binding protein YceI
MTASRSLLPGLVLAVAFAGAAAAQPVPSAAGLPPGVFVAGKDLAAATAGTYALDPNHAAVVARVSHLGYSYSIFRFDKVEGALTWDPAAPTRSKLSVSVDTASIDTNVEGFAAELAGDKFLDAKTYPKATFVSTAFRQTGLGKGQVDGRFTLKGKTVPMTFEVDLGGVGKGFGGKPRIGVEAHGKLDPQDFGLAPMLPGPIDLVINVEFEKAA